MPTTLAETTLPACVVLTLAAAKSLSAYVVYPIGVAESPIEFTFSGSADGEDWAELDWRTAEVFVANIARTFPVVSVTAYKYYRLRVTDTTSGTLLILGVSLMERIASITGHGEGESETSKSHALQVATLAAEADAAADLAAHCRQLYQATASRSHTCPLGMGTVTGNGVGASFESEDDAHRQAKQEANARADAALAECETGNYTSAILIPHSGIATPYPSVKFVQGLTGTIQKVVVHLILASHESPDDIQMLLVSPSGTKVKLWQNAGGLTPFAFLNITFDDAAVAAIGDAITPAGISYKPSIYPGPGATVMLPPAPPTPYNTLLSAFANENPNGYWALYVADDTNLFGGSIAGGFDMTITLNP